MKSIWICFLVMVWTVTNCHSPAFAMAKKPQEDFAKAFPEEGLWLNSQPIEKPYQPDRITLLYFWDYTSSHALRDLSKVMEWHKVYSAYGLEWILVHTPEYRFAHHENNVAQALERMGINEPVYLDNQAKMWEEYDIHSWPTKVLIGPDGRILHTQIGEIEYVETEIQIRSYLSALHPMVVLPDVVIPENPVPPTTEYCGPVTAETYLGYKRVSWWGGELANKRTVRPEDTLNFRDDGERVQRGFFLHGLWSNQEDYFEHARETEGLSDYIGLLYFGQNVYAVMGNLDEEQSARAYITRDENPVPPEFQGEDLEVDLTGQTYIELGLPRLYHLISNENERMHELKVWTQNKGAMISSFVFANRCMGKVDLR